MFWIVLIMTNTLGPTDDDLHSVSKFYFKDYLLGGRVNGTGSFSKWPPQSHLVEWNQVPAFLSGLPHGMLGPKFLVHSALLIWYGIASIVSWGLLFLTNIQFQAQKPYLVQRRGAEFALTTIVKHFGGEMAKKLPHLWDAMIGPLRNMIDINNFGMCIFF